MESSSDVITFREDFYELISINLSIDWCNNLKLWIVTV